MQIITSNPQILIYEPYLSAQLCREGYHLLDNDELEGFDWHDARSEWPRRHIFMLEGTLGYFYNLNT